MYNLFLGYLFVDPAKEMFSFVIPILGRPLLWYGFLFAFGFFIAHLILSHLLQRYFVLFPQVEERQVVSWHGFLYDLQEKHDRKKEEMKKALFSLVSRPTQEWCLQNPLPGEVPILVKKELLQAINTVIKQDELVLDQKNLLSKYCEKLSPQERRESLNRIYFDALFSKYFETVAKTAKSFVEKLSLYVIVGAVIGARLGDVIFYQNWHYYLAHPLSILKTWEGGLASHGGVIGILLALALFYLKMRKERPINWIKLIDFCAIPTAFAAAFIRIGNFMNQEILGKATLLPWGVMFGHPVDGLLGVARHPVQLYESFFYFALGGFLSFFWRNKSWKEKEGRLGGIFLVALFSFRFFIEFFKEEQSVWLTEGHILNMGHYLSLPLIILGCYLLFLSKKEFSPEVAVERN